MTDNDIVTRLNRIVTGADERGLDETECRAIRDAAAEIMQLRLERDSARRDACEFGAMLETDANPNYDPESGDFAKIAMRIAYLKGWDCWRDYEKENTNDQE